jgi:hypothetical protein
LEDKHLDVQKQEIAELVKIICLAALNWEFKHSDEHYGIKKHQEEFILIKSQDVSYHCTIICFYRSVLIL